VESHTGPLLEIVALCREMDALAQRSYQRLAKLSGDPGLTRFWAGMADEEQLHVRFWNSVREMADDGLLPPLVEDPVQTLRDLRETKRKAEEFWPRCEADPSVLNTFLMAYRLEFTLLCPAVAAFFHYMKTTSAESPEDHYGRHLTRFGEKLLEMGATTPELELLGEAMLRLWTDNRSLALQSAQDELTGVLNRRGLFNAIRPLAFLALRNGLNVGIMMIDIDDFRTINADHGHLKGDSVLVAVAKSILTRMRKSDIVGRYGGEEFVVFMPEVDPRALGRIGEDVRRRVDAEAREGIRATVSVGAASGILEVDAEGGVMDLIKRADNCLYTAKRSGKNRVAVDGG
jgi:diguanylate cyclase (GGDEF)-like protein